VEKARRYGVEGLAESLLEVADSLEMALEAGEQASVASLLEGSAGTLKQLQSAMEKHGIVAIYPEGEPFDPELHEAMSMVESTTAEPDTVVAVVQRGYQLNGRLLRPARVMVAREASEDKG
jgi:molecular chaperone GrpE